MTTQTIPSPPINMASAHARYFDTMAALMGGHFPKVHYLGSRDFDQFFGEVRQYVRDSGQEWHGTDDTFYFRGVRIIRTGEP